MKRRSTDTVIAARSPSRRRSIARRSPSATHRLPEAYRLGVSREHPWSAEHFMLLGGTPKSYVKTAESGNKRRHAFCADCGTPIYACAVDNPQTMLCVSVRSPSVRPSHRGGKSGGVRHCAGSTRSPPYPRPREGDALNAGG